MLPKNSNTLDIQRKDIPKLVHRHKIKNLKQFQTVAILA